MPEGFRQTATALELFGRGGKAILAILKEMDGDLDGATRRFREMGILISTEAAKAADKFNDQLALLGFQIRSVTAIVGNEAMPTILSALTSISKAFQDNQGTIRAWVNDTADAARGALVLANAIRAIGTQIIGLSNLPVPGILQVLGSVSGLPNIFQGLQRLGTPAIGPLNVPEVVAPKIGLPTFPTIKPGGRGRQKATKRDSFLQDALQDAALAEREALQTIEADIAENKRALDEQVRDIEEFTRRAIELEDKRHDAAIVRINKDQEALDTALARKLISLEDYNRKDRELTTRNDEAKEKNQQEIFELNRERNLKISAAEIASQQRADRIAEEADQRTIARIEKRINQGVLLESEGEQQIAAIVEQGFQRRKETLTKEEQAYATTLERRKAIVDELVILEGQRAKAAEDATQRILKAQFDEQNRGFGDATRPRSALAAIAEKGPFANLTEELTKAGILSGETAKIIGETLAGAFNQLSSAVGNAVQSFVLFGKVEGGFKRFAAEVIASLAATAAVQAVYQLAQGLAWLALNFFFPNPAYAKAAATAFASAAVFGSIAGVAALAGRVISGNSFAGNSGSGESPSGTSRSQGAPAPKPIDVDRRSGFGGSAPVKVIHEIHLKGEAADLFEAKFIERYNQNGRLRDFILSDGRR